MIRHSILRHADGVTAALALLMALGCGAAPQAHTTTAPTTDGTSDPAAPEVQKESPPASGPSRDIDFPPVASSELANGLMVDAVKRDELPVVYLRLVVRSGSETDPKSRPGLAHMVASMLKDGGTRSLPSAKLAEAVEFLGADLWTYEDGENLHIGARALSSQLDRIMELVADVALNPSFSQAELDKLRKRELDRLALQRNNPNFLASEAFYRELYGEHPYARIDTNEAAVKKISRNELQAWHKQHVVPNNAFLTVVGAVTQDEVTAAAKKHFGKWRKGKVREVTYPEVKASGTRRVVIVDRPESVQSVIMVGNPALKRRSDDYTALLVTNQVLGGSPASRLFLDLRERRSLTYGAYSSVSEQPDVGTFAAQASVRNEVTQEAVSAFYEHFDRLRNDVVAQEELANAQRYLSDRFPLEIDTPAKIGQLLSEIRIFGLPADYWASYRTDIQGVSSEAVKAAAQKYITPESSLLVIVGKAADMAEGLRSYGEVKVVDSNGTTIETLPATGSAEAAAE